MHPEPVGAAGTPVFNGKIDDWEDENEKTKGENWRGRPGTIGEARKMLTHTHVKSARDVVIDPVVAGEYDFDAGGSRPIDKEAAKWCRRVFFQRLPWKRHLGAIMRSYYSDGFAVVEKTDDVVPFPQSEFPLHPGKGLGVEITGLYVRPGWSIYGWDQNPRDATQVVGVQQYVSGSDTEDPGFITIPSDRFIRFTWEQVGANYEGDAPQRAQWGPWYLIRMLTRIEAIGHEKNHLSQPIASREELSAGSDDDDKKLLKVLSAFSTHEKGSFVLPYGYKLEWSQHGQQTNIAATIKELKFDIAHSNQAGFTLLGSNSSGSHALAGTQKGQFDLGEYKHADFLCDVFNHGLDGWSIVERIVRLNYGSDVAIPLMVVRYLPTVDFTKTLPILKDLAVAGLIRRTARIEAYGLRGLRAPQFDPDDEVFEAPAVAAAPSADQPQQDQQQGEQQGSPQ